MSKLNTTLKLVLTIKVILSATPQGSFNITTRCEFPNGNIGNKEPLMILRTLLKWPMSLITPLIYR